MAAKFEIVMHKDGKCHVRYVAANGEVVNSSKTLDTEAAGKVNVKSAKKCSKAKVVVIPFIEAEA